MLSKHIKLNNNCELCKRLKLGKNDSDFLFDERFSVPKKPQQESESDEEYTEKVENWKTQVANVEKRLVIEAKLAQPELEKLKTELVSSKRHDFFGSLWYYLLLLLPFIALPILVLLRKRKEALDGDVIGNRIRMNNRLAKKYLSEAKKHIHNKEPFYVALEKAMHNFLKAKLHIETSEMSKDNIQELLLSRNANPETVTDFIALTENCELARYAPASSTSIQNDFDKAVEIISELEKQI
jgi:hypothetical protein